MNKKGFALVEMLIILIIVVVIAIFATQNVVDNAKLEVGKTKKVESVDTPKINALAVINAVRTAYTEDQMTEAKYVLGDKIEFGNNPRVGSSLIRISGKLPESGFVIIQNDGFIIAENLKFSNYSCSTIKSETDKTVDPNNMVCVKEN